MAGTLVYGVTGSGVRQAQRALLAAGYPTPADGMFGRDTENAVRTYQRAHGLLPDGRIGPRTFACLNRAAAPLRDTAATPLTDLPQRFGPAVTAPATAALSAAALPGSKRACAALRVSDQGLMFILAEEAGADGGNVCWPRGHSGVTLGAGYDMRGRTAVAIEADMLAVGLSVEDACIMRAASGRDERDGSAQAWVDTHRDWPALTRTQQIDLLKRVVPDYEAVVHKSVGADLWQYQFDALVSVAYNPERSVGSLAAKVNAGSYGAAAEDILSRVGSASDVSRGLKARREREMALFLYGNYSS